jgi:eukaryotic-like serine/threonine-protein kinase
LTSLDVDTRSDVYSLGVLLYELLTGRTPIDEETMRKAGLDEMRRIIREVDPPRPSARVKTLAGADLTTAAKRRHTEPAKLPNSLHGDLDWIVMKCLEKDRKRRYDTANGLALDLRRHLENEIVTARPPTASYLLSKLVRRNKLAFAASAAVALALVLGIVASLWQAFRATTAEKSAKNETRRAVMAEASTRTEADRATKAEALASQRLRESEAARRESEKARANAEAISKFLTGMFHSTRPGDEKGGREVKVADVLDIAAKKLETELAGQPDRRDQLRATLAGTYYALGLYPPAIALQEKVRDYRLSVFGPENRSTLLATKALAESYHLAGRVDEAIKLCEEALPLFRKVFGEERPETLWVMGALAYSYEDAGRQEEALKLREKVLALRRKVQGAEHPNTLTAMHSLAGSYVAARRFEDALKLCEEAVPLFRKVLGDKHPQTLNGMQMLAVTYASVGRQDEALKLREEVYVLKQKVFGPEHRDTFWAMWDLASSYDSVGRQEKAQKLRDEIKALQDKARSARKPEVETAPAPPAPGPLPTPTPASAPTSPR